MDEVSPADLVLAALWEAGGNHTKHEQSLADLLDIVTDGEGLGQQVEVGVAIETLAQEGLIGRETTGQDERVFLTADGKQRGQTIYQEFSDTEIEVLDENERKTAPLGRVAARRELSLAAVAAACSDDGVYDDREDIQRDTLIDREAELETWIQLIDRAIEAGRGEVVLVAGPGGIGKSTLVEAFVDSVPSAVDVMYTHCREAGAEPYQPIRDAVTQLDTDTDPFADTGPNSFSSVETDRVEAEAYEAQQTALFHDVTELLCADDGMRVLVLDDVDITDSATITYLWYLLEQLQDKRLVVVGTHRPGGLPDSSPFADPSSIAVPVTEFELGGFDRAETAQLIEQTVGTRGPPSAFVDAVFERTEGIPRFISATVEALLESDQLDEQYQWHPESPAEIELPEEVRETVVRQVDVLDDTAQDILRWMAVAGKALPVTVLQTVCDWPPDRVSTTIDVLVEADVFRWEKINRRIAFRSNVTREALLDELDTETRQRYHRELAETLEADLDATATAVDRATTIAHHYEQAGDTDTAIEWYQAGAKRASELYANETAIEQYTRVLELARNHDLDTVLETGQQLADIYTQIGEYEQARRYVEFVRERTGEEEIHRRQQLAHKAAKIAESIGEFDTAYDEITAGLAVNETPSSERGQLLLLKAEYDANAGNAESAEKALDEQDDIAAAIDDVALRAQGAITRGRLAETRSEYKQARDQYETALETFRSLDDRAEIAGTYNLLGLVARKQGNFREAREYHEQALTVYQTIGDRHAVGITANNLGLVAWRESEYDTARRYLEDAIETARTMQDSHTLALGQLNLANVCREQGQYEQASEYYEQALSRFESTSSTYLVGITHHDMGKLANRLGDYERARDHCQQALDTYEAADNDHHAGAVRNILGLIATRCREYDTAAQHFETALELARIIENDTLVGKIQTNQGVLAAAQGEHDRAVERSEKAIDVLEDVGQQWFLGRARLTLAQATLESGDIGQAQEHATQAFEGYEEIGARHGMAQAEITLGQIASERGDDEAAREYFERACQRCEALDAWRDHLRALQGLVAVDLQTENEAQVRERCELALILIEDKESVPPVESDWFQQRLDSLT